MALSISSIETVKKGGKHSAREISADWCHGEGDSSLTIGYCHAGKIKR
jgi:hypothetical protein